MFLPQLVAHVDPLARITDKIPAWCQSGEDYATARQPGLSMVVVGPKDL